MSADPKLCPAVKVAPSESMKERLPCKYDPFACLCGGLGSGVFVAGATSDTNPCPDCGDVVVIACSSCGQVFCVGCLKVASRKARDERGVPLLGDVGTLS